MIKDINEPITFWLDAHYFPLDMYKNKNHKISELPGYGKVPLIDELNQIKRHSIKSHTILIDDIAALSNLDPLADGTSTGTNETKVDNLIKFIRSINQNYCFVESSHDFLICRVV
jgi:hypothetical protein